MSTLARISVRRAMTLLEAVLAVTVLSIVAAVLLPVISGATDAYAASQGGKAAAESAGFALDRCVRVVREAPAGLDPGTAGFATINTDRIELSDGKEVYLDGTDLIYRDGARDAVLARDVDAFVVEYLLEDGRTPAASAETVHRVHLTLSSRGITLSGVAFPRVLMVVE